MGTGSGTGLSGSDDRVRMVGTTFRQVVFK